MAMMIAALLLAAPAEPTIRVEAAKNDSFTATVDTFDSAQFEAVMARVTAAARQRCGALSVRFGRHFFDSRVDTARNVMTVENLRQSFFCFDPATDPYKPVPADWTASAAETSSITVFVTRFLDRLDRGDAGGMAMMDPLIEITKPDWDHLREGVVQSRTGDGGGTLTPKLLGWANNPDGATYPGAYALFSVFDDHEGIADTCGGIMVQRVRENEYRIAQFDVQFISQELVDRRGLTDADVEALCAR